MHIILIRKMVERQPQIEKKEKKTNTSSWYFIDAIAVDSVATADVIKIISRIENLHLDAI